LLQYIQFQFYMLSLIKRNALTISSNSGLFSCSYSQHLTMMAISTLGQSGGINFMFGLSLKCITLYMISWGLYSLNGGSLQMISQRTIYVKDYLNPIILLQMNICQLCENRAYSQGSQVTSSGRFLPIQSSWLPPILNSK
jgi:hypothetical protein